MSTPKKKMSPVKMVVNPLKPESLEIMADHIKQVSQAFKQLNNGPVTRRVILLLLKDSITPAMSIADIEQVLVAAERLSTRYVK